ncbi:MAG TPA: hypothetical protein VKS01_01785 [Bryobacteraceae bacterium]|nr:hypothetical protein [Bryobacteraceae bacterium]
MVSPEIALERFLYEKHSRGESQYAKLGSRIAVEDLPTNHLYRFLVDWMNRQLSDIGVNSTGGRALPPLHFDLVDANNELASAHVFETVEFGFIVATKPLVDEMRRLSRRLIAQNLAFMRLQIAPSATLPELAHVLVLVQLCLVTSHEYSHLVRGHLEDYPPDTADVGGLLSQAQELEADGFGIYHELEYFFRGGGRQSFSTSLRISNERALENSILSCFLLSIMVQFCARWAGKIQVEYDDRAEHPPLPMRIQYSLLFVEMWCREVGSISTLWMTDGTLGQYFGAAARLFSSQEKATWDQLVGWLKSPQSEEYQVQVRRGFDRVRTASVPERN